MVLTLGTGGRLEAGYLVNEDWKSLNLLKEIIPLKPGKGPFVLPSPVYDLKNKIPGKNEEEEKQPPKIAWNFPPLNF